MPKFFRTFAICLLAGIAPWAVHAIPPPGAPLGLSPSHGKPDNKNISDLPCAEFAAWLKKFQQAGTGKAELERDGLSLAAQRRATMLLLFDGDPERAMKWALSASDRALLPAAMLASVEKPVSGCGPFDVLAASISDPKTGAFHVEISRYATLQGKPYKARVYGRRQSATTKYNVPMHGIAFDNILLLHPDALRTLEIGEVAPAGGLCPYCGHRVGKIAVAAQWGEEIFTFDSPDHFRKVEDEIERRERVMGPKEGFPCDTPIDKIVASLKERELKAEGGDFVEDHRDKPFGD